MCASCTGVVESGDGAFVKVPYRYQWNILYGIYGILLLITILPIKLYSNV